MVRWFGVVSCVLAVTGTAQAAPVVDLFAVGTLDVDAVGLDARLMMTGLTVPRQQSTAHRPSVGLSHYRSGAEVGRGVAGWLLSASFFSVCLTAGVSGLMAGDPEMVAETLGEPGTLEALVIPDWASGIARALGVVSFEIGRAGDALERDERGSGLLEVTLLPIGPENAAGVSVTGCFR